MTIDQVERLRDRLISQFFFARYQVVCDAQVLNDWSNVLAERLKVPPMTIFDSMSFLVGRPITRDDAFRVAWRLAGGLDLLKQGRSLPPWSRQTGREEVLVYLHSFEAGTDNHHRSLAKYTGTIYTGTPAGLEGLCAWPRSLLAAIARRVGFTNVHGSYPMRHPAEMVGLRVCVVVEPHGGESRPYFSQIVEKPALVTWNRKNVLAYRTRKTPCPQQRLNPCHECPVGLAECQAATHLKTRQEATHVGGDGHTDATGSGGGGPLVPD